MTTCAQPGRFSIPYPPARPLGSSIIKLCGFGCRHDHQWQFFSKMTDYFPEQIALVSPIDADRFKGHHAALYVLGRVGKARWSVFLEVLKEMR
jgi:hypothetical protein